MTNQRPPGAGTTGELEEPYLVEQLATQADAFQLEGGLTERLYRSRKAGYRW
jgi:four helix bundle suffix protein